MNVHPRQCEAAERRLQGVERQPRVQQRAERHVAGYAGEAIEVKHLHNRPDSLRLQYQASPRMM